MTTPAQIIKTDFNYSTLSKQAFAKVIERYMTRMGQTPLVHIYCLSQHYIDTTLTLLSHVEAFEGVTTERLHDVHDMFLNRDKVLGGVVMFYNKDGAINSLGRMYLREIHRAFQMILSAIHIRDELSFKELEAQARDALDSIMEPHLTDAQKAIYMVRN